MFVTLVLIVVLAFFASTTVPGLRHAEKRDFVFVRGVIGVVTCVVAMLVKLFG